MHSDLAPSDANERYVAARQAAKDGLGWNDLVVRYGVEEQIARMLVWEAELNRFPKAHRSAT